MRPLLISSVYALHGRFTYKKNKIDILYRNVNFAFFTIYYNVSVSQCAYKFNLAPTISSKYGLNIICFLLLYGTAI